MGLQLLTIDDLKFPEGKQPELLLYDWGSAGKTYEVVVITRDGMERQACVTSSNRTVNSRSFRLSNLPLIVSAESVSANIRRGEIYVLAKLRFGAIRDVCLFCGYIEQGKAMSWPGGHFEGMTEGPGLLRSITGTDPAAGAEVSETVPANARWRIRGLRFGLVTNATVATRRMCLVCDDGTNIFYRLAAYQTQAASLTYNYSFHPEYACDGYLRGTEVMIGISVDLLLFQGWRIRTSTESLQAGDNYGAPQLMVEEWIEE